jgi:threonine dehydratase
MTKLVDLATIQRSRRNLPTFIRRTPILPLSRESSEVGKERLFLKAENLQITGAFKPRAAFSVMSSLSEEDRAKGVVLASSGNFAQAFAYAGRHYGVPIVVVMLDRTSPYKVEATKQYGADVVFCGDALSRQSLVEEIASSRGMTAINTWEDPAIIAGHGSIGHEIIEDCRQVQVILVPVSSGGLAAGVAAAVKQSRKDVAVIGVQPEGANAAYVSLRRGTATTIDYWNTMADGLSAVRPGEFPLEHLSRYLDEIVLVSELDIASAFRTILFRGKSLVEPAGAVAAAAFLSGKVNQLLVTVAVASGGNVTEDVIQAMLAMSLGSGETPATLS